MRIGFFPNMGKSTIMAVLKMAAHICREEQIEVYLPNDLERPDTYKVLQVPKDHVLPRPEIFKHIDVAFSFGGDGTIIHLARQIFSYNIPVDRKSTTSELQSLAYLVCRLLLEKKKKKK